MRKRAWKTADVWTNQDGWRWRNSSGDSPRQGRPKVPRRCLWKIPPSTLLLRSPTAILRLTIYLFAFDTLSPPIDRSCSRFASTREDRSPHPPPFEIEPATRPTMTIMAGESSKGKAPTALDLDGHDLPPSPAPSTPRNGRKYALATELVYLESNDQYNASSVPIYQVRGFSAIWR
jgi:hypothetical protein